MVYTLEEIKNDLKELSDREFYIKHIIRSDNWYIEDYLGKRDTEIVKTIDDYRLIVSNSFNVTINSVIMVGSGKNGFSMSPPNVAAPEMTKTFLPFNNDEKVRKVSDIDIAIVSDELFHEFWSLFRESYKKRYENTYRHVYQEIYRGYLNERNIVEVEGCRVKWNTMASAAKNKLHSDLFFHHNISFRIYRSWTDFEAYNLQNIKALQRGL